MKNIDVLVSDVFLHPDNPRHERIVDPLKAIEYLCNNEDVFALARDIQKNGLNPLERFAFVKIADRTTEDVYRVAEGNRRLCALKLLLDPELAPTQFKKKFESLAKSWVPVKSISGVLFPNLKSAKIWLERIHNGPQGGIGRKSWNSEQKTRFDDSSKNILAQKFLDYAENSGFLKPEDRKNRLTTVQRFFANRLFADAIGFELGSGNIPLSTRPKKELEIVSKRFLTDLLDGKDVHSRCNKEKIEKYASVVVSLEGVSSNKISPEPISYTRPRHLKPTPKKTAKIKLAQPQTIQYKSDIAVGLSTLDNEKLSSLYQSLHTISLEDHVPLLGVGVWCFFECLTACIGRDERTQIDAFLSKKRLDDYGFGSETKALQEVMCRIREYGNTTKHHKKAAVFNGRQLYNDMNVVSGLILKLVSEAVSQKDIVV